MKPDEDQALAGLWNPEVRSIEEVRTDTVFTTLREILQYLFLDAHLGHSLDVFHYEGSGFNLADDTDELAI